MKGIKTVGILLVSVLLIMAVVGCSGSKDEGGSAASPSNTESTSASASPDANENTSASPDTQESGIPKLTYKGDITMWAGSYTPKVDGVYLPPNSPEYKAFKEAADAFNKLYPDIHIKFVNSSTYGTMEWYQTQAAAGRLPDVSYILFANSQSLPTGTFTDLNPYFDKPNPFIEGNQKWSDVMNEAALDMTQLEDGIHYEIDGDWASFSFWYNKDLFKKAGITEPPTSWEDLINVSKKLKDQGINPGATVSAPIYNWFAHMFIANYLGEEGTKKVLEVKGNESAGLTLDQAIKWYDEGTLNPSKNPAVQAWWPAAKELLSLWDRDTLNVPVNNTNPNAPDPLAYLAAQKVAMAYIGGTGVINVINNLPEDKRFELGSFNITDLSGTSEYATDMVTFQDVGGPFAGFQYAVSTPKSNKTLTDEKMQAVIAWLQFFGSPEWNEKIVNEQGNAIPIFKGTKANPVVRPMQEAIQNNPFWTIWLYDSLGPKAFPEYASLFLDYARGNISFEEAKKKYNELTDKTVKEYKKDNNMN